MISKSKSKLGFQPGDTVYVRDYILDKWFKGKIKDYIKEFGIHKEPAYSVYVFRKKDNGRYSRDIMIGTLGNIQSGKDKD